MLFLIAYF